MEAPGHVPSVPSPKSGTACDRVSCANVCLELSLICEDQGEVITSD